MKIWFLIIVAMSILLPSCSNNVICRIEGKIINLENPTAYVVFESEGVNIIDTVVFDKKGRFKVEQKKDDFQQATFFFDERRSWFTVYLDSKTQKITITGDARYPELLYAKGGRVNNELSSFRKKTESLLREGADLRIAINNSPSSEKNELFSRYANVKFQLNEHVQAYIHTNPNKASSVVLIKNCFMNPDDIRILDELLISIDPALKDFYIVRELEQYSIRAKRTALGAEAPDFMVRNIYGDSVKLDNFSKKYILLTFTVPWCDMCSTDDLHLDEIDRTYPKDRIEQLLVTLDSDIDGVREILKKDSLRWNLVADSAGQATMLLNLYNVSSLPRCFLIDDERKIILKTENGVEMKQTLERLIK